VPTLPIEDVSVHVVEASRYSAGRSCERSYRGNERACRSLGSVSGGQKSVIRGLGIVERQRRVWRGLEAKDYLILTINITCSF